MERINDPITLDVMTNYEAQGEETPEQKYQRVYEQNKELYDRLSKATEQSIQYTLDAIREAEELKGSKMEINELIESYNDYVKKIPGGAIYIANYLREDKLNDALIAIKAFQKVYFGFRKHVTY